MALYGQQTFDLILMGGQMPVMDGIEAKQTIWRIEREKDAGKTHIPIIALTANAMKGDRERFMVSGMDDFIAKPIKRKALEDAIVNSSKLIRVPETMEVKSREPVMIKNDIIDLDELIKTMNGDKHLVRECFDDFFHHHGHMLNRIRAGIDASDGKRVKEALLSFRESSQSPVV
ncbi:MAG: response regulator [Pseudomonadota bacterium]